MASTTRQETVTITDVVAAVTPKAVLLKGSERPFARAGDQPWIPKSQIVDCDADLDEIEVGDEITVEIPVWLAREKELA